MTMVTPRPSYCSFFVICPIVCDAEWQPERRDSIAQLDFNRSLFYQQFLRLFPWVNKQLLHSCFEAGRLRVRKICFHFQLVSQYPFIQCSDLTIFVLPFS